MWSWYLDRCCHFAKNVTILSSLISGVVVSETTPTSQPNGDSERDSTELPGEGVHQDNATDERVVETETHTVDPAVEDPLTGGTKKSTLGPTFTTGGFDSAGSGMQPTLPEEETVSPIAHDEIQPTPERDSVSIERKKNTRNLPRHYCCRSEHNYCCISLKYSGSGRNNHNSQYTSGDCHRVQIVLYLYLDCIML